MERVSFNRKRDSEGNETSELIHLADAKIHALLNVKDFSASDKDYSHAYVMSRKVKRDTRR